MNPLKRISHVLIDFSTQVKKGENVIINFDYPAIPLALELYRQCIVKGAHPDLKPEFEEARYIFYKNATKQQLQHMPKHMIHLARETDVFIFISAPKNTKDLISVDKKNLSIRSIATKDFRDIRHRKRWVIFDYPTPALAQEAGMSLEQYQRFSYGACFVDYKELEKKTAKLHALLSKTDKIHIISGDTDLTFSIKGTKPENANGYVNMPDGEIFTSVVKNSVNGHIAFPDTQIHNHNSVEGIVLEFKNGKVVRFGAKKNIRYLKSMLDMDSGSRYLGELGIGTNPKITKFTHNILFDEKIIGTIHLALGDSFEETVKMNRSALHWDMIKDMKKGKVYADKKLIMDKGKILV